MHEINDVALKTLTAKVAMKILAAKAPALEAKGAGVTCHVCALPT